MKTVNNAQQARDMVHMLGMTITIDVMMERITAQAEKGESQYILPRTANLPQYVIKELIQKGFEVEFRRPAYHDEKHFIISW